MENLLSKKEKESLRKGYKKRLIIIWCWLTVLALPVFFVLAAPVYFAAGLKLNEVQERNKVNDFSNSDQVEVFSLPELIDKKSEAVLAYKNLRGSYELLLSAIESAPDGVALSQIIFERSQNKRLDVLKISGIAKDRETLSAYEQAIKSLPYVAAASVPVESFSRPVNLSFLVNVTLASSTAAK